MLIRKTTVLTGKNVQGHVTLIRVGSSVGLKLILDPAPREELLLCVVAGDNPQINVPVRGARTETNVDLNLEARDDIGAVVYTATGEAYMWGGKRERVSRPKETASAPDLPSSIETAQVQVSEESLKSDADTAPVQEEPVADTEPVQEEVPSEALRAVSDEEVTETSYTETVNEENSDTMTEVGDENELKQEVFSPFKFNRGENFYQNIRFRLEEIMTINPECKELEKIIPESKWVKVYYDEEEYYVVGILTEDGEVTYLGYGVPGVEGIRPPKEAEELCDFLPVSGGEEEGYWLMFQNSKNGELVKSLK